MKKALKIEGFPQSNLSINELINLSKQPFFKIGIKERASRVGSISYKGFKYVFHRNPKDKKLYVFVNMYFYIKGAKHNNFRETYLLVVKFPYIKNIKNMKRLYNANIQIFSSDPSFKFYFAYALEQHGAVVKDEKEFVKHLGIALRVPPVKRNPEWRVQLTKHFYKLFNFIANAKPKKYLSKEWQIPSKQRITIINTNATTSREKKKKTKTKPKVITNRIMRKKHGTKPKISKTKRSKRSKR